MDTDGSVSSSLQAAYILHYREFQESSFIVDAFTLTHGRIALVAKSARNSKPRTRALYQPFRPLLLSWVGAGDLRTLTGIEESGQALEMADAELACAYYLNELVLRLAGKDQPQATIFAYYSMALEQLASQTISIQEVLRTFEVQLLDGLGVLPNFAYCTGDGRAVDPSREYRYHPANAIAVVTNRPAIVQGADQDSAEVVQNTYLGLQKEKHRMGASDSRNPNIQADGMTRDEGVLVDGSTLIALSELELSDATVLSQAKLLMRHVLRVHLGDKPLRSRELFDSLVRRK
ncbi:MAG: DNA repair protein RecO (recombination protein O) [Granulosicoccus sp.]|jgi:DNA repair protein RecO (recombination protein O)